jgi:hypothetical protein
MVGDSPQSGMGNLSPTTMTNYLADREAKGFNTVWENLICASYTDCNSNGTTFDGVKPFTTGTTPSNYDLSTPNSTYFARMHAMIAQAQTDGIEIMLDPIETGGCVTGGWMDTLIANGNGTTSSSTKDYQYGQYLGNTFKDLPNIMWISGNDFLCYHTTADNNDALAVAEGIQNTDPSALQTIELDFFNPATSNSSMSLDDTAWNSVNTINSAYTYAPTYHEVLNGYVTSSTVPVIMQEASYEQEQNGDSDGCITVRNCRLQEWWTMTSGATGQLYGCHCSLTFTDGGTIADLDTTGVTQLGYETTLLNSIAWQTLVPDQTTGSPNSTFVTSGNGTCPTTGAFASVTCLTDSRSADGHLALIYMPTSRAITVNMALMSGSSVTARWYDPTNGTFTTVSGSPFTLASHSISAPGNNNAGNSDWALLLQAS